MKSRFLLPASLLLLATASPLAAQAYRVGTRFEPRVSGGRVDALVTTPDGLWTVYAGDQRLAGVRELFAVPSDGSAPPRRLSRPMAYLGDVQIGDANDEPLGLYVTADGSRAVYRADVEVDERFELWSVRIAGSGVPNPVRLNPELDPGDIVNERVRLVPSASGGCGWVVFAVGTTSGLSDLREMWVAPADGSVPAWRIDADTGLDIQDFSVSSDGTRVLYVHHGLGMIAALDGSGSPVDVAPGAVEARLSPDGTRVVYRDFQSALHRLYSVPSSGGTPILLANDAFDFQISPDSGHVVYSWGGATIPRISCVPIAGGTARALSETGGGSLVQQYAITAAGRVVFRGIQPVHGRGLYAVDIASGGPQPLSDPIVSPELVWDFRLNAQGTVALYRAGAFGAIGLHAVRLDGTTAPIALAVDVENDYRFTPDGFSACYRTGEIPPSTGARWAAGRPCGSTSWIRSFPRSRSSSIRAASASSSAGTRARRSPPPFSSTRCAPTDPTLSGSTTGACRTRWPTSRASSRPAPARAACSSPTPSRTTSTSCGAPRPAAGRPRCA